MAVSIPAMPADQHNGISIVVSRHHDLLGCALRRCWGRASPWYGRSMRVIDYLDSTKMATQRWLVIHKGAVRRTPVTSDQGSALGRSGPGRMPRSRDRLMTPTQELMGVSVWHCASDLLKRCPSWLCLYGHVCLRMVPTSWATGARSSGRASCSTV